MQSLLPEFGIVRVTGDDRATFLHGQLSNDIHQLQPNQACYATYNTPKGRVIANMIVANQGEALFLIIPSDLVEKTISRLKMFVLRAKVLFEPLIEWGVAVEWTNTLQPQPATTPQLSFDAEYHPPLWHIHLPHQGILLLGKKSDLPQENKEVISLWQQHEIESGYPWITAATSENAVAQMLNQHIIGGVHFKKGCYPGQEIIARAQYRGQVKRGLASFTSSDITVAGEPLLCNGEDAGTIINTTHVDQTHTVLAVIKHVFANQTLQTNAGAVLSPQTVFFNTENIDAEK